jgi:uncharacterized membrane protein
MTAPAALTNVAAAAPGRTAAPAAVRLPVDLGCMTGLRALSSIAVVFFHCFLGLWIRMVPFETHATLMHTNWLVRCAMPACKVAVSVRQRAG